MNAELKTLMQERNRLRRDMGANRDVWVAKTRELLEKTQEAKRSTWRAHLEEGTRTKDAKKACEEPEWVCASTGWENHSLQRP